jgi:hypothetical protein
MKNVLQEIPLDAIMIPAGRSKKFDARDEKNQQLMDGMHKAGLIKPIDVRKVQGKDQYELIIGRRRYGAAKALGWTTIRCLVTDWPDEHLNFLIFAENLHRKHMSPAEEARAIKQILAEFERIFGPDPGKATGGRVRARTAHRNPETQSFVSESHTAEASTTDQQGEDQEQPAFPAAGNAGSPQSDATRPHANILAEAIGKGHSQTYERIKIAEAFSDEELVVLGGEDLSQADLLALAQITDPIIRTQVVNLVLTGLPVAEALKTLESPASRQITEELRTAQLSDSQWLETYGSGIRDQLQDRTIYDREALLYRRTNDHRTEHRSRSKELVLKAKHTGYGPYSNLLARTFWVDHPHEWLLCGECRGRNVDQPNCSDCYGCGFKLSYTFPLKGKK